MPTRLVVTRILSNLVVRRRHTRGVLVIEGGDTKAAFAAFVFMYVINHLIHLEYHLRGRQFTPDRGLGAWARGERGGEGEGEGEQGPGRRPYTTVSPVREVDTRLTRV